MSNFLETYASPSFLGDLFEKNKKQHEDAQKAMEAFMPELTQLEMDATSAVKAYSSGSQAIMDQNHEIFQDLVKTRSLGPIGKIIGLVDPQYNENVLITKGQENAQALTNSRNILDTNLALIGKRGDVLKSRISTTEKIAEGGDRVVSQLLQSINAINAIEDQKLQRQSQAIQLENQKLEKQGLALRVDEAKYQLEERTKARQRAFLVSVDSKKLETALQDNKDAPTIKIDGVEYPREVVYGAYSDKADRSFKLKELAATVDKNDREATNAKLEDLSKFYGMEEVNQQQPDALGNIALRDNEGNLVANVNKRDMLNRVMKNSADGQEATKILAELQSRSAGMQAEFTGAMERAQNVINLTAGTPEGQKLLAATKSSIEMANQFVDATKRREAKDPPTVEDITLFSPLGQQVAQNKTKFLDDTATAALEAFKKGKSEPVVKAIDQMAVNNGMITDAQIAGAVLSQNAFFPSQFSDYNGPLGIYMQNYMSKEQEKTAGAFAMDDKGQFKNSTAAFNAMLNSNPVKDNQTTRWLNLDKSIKDIGFQGGFSEAAAAAHVDYLTLTYANMYKKKIDSVKGQTVLSDLLTPSGQWSPKFLALRDKGGTLGALKQAFAEREAVDMASGKITPNMSEFSGFMSLMLSAMQGEKPELHLPQPRNPNDAAIISIVYNNQPNQVLQHAVSGALSSYPAYVLQMVKDMNANQMAEKGTQRGTNPLDTANQMAKSVMHINDQPNIIETNSLERYMKSRGIAPLP